MLPKTGMKLRPCRGPQASWQEPTELELLLGASICCLSAKAAAVLLPEEVSLLGQLDFLASADRPPVDTSYALMPVFNMANARA